MKAIMFAWMRGHRRRRFIFHDEPVCFDQSAHEVSANVCGWLLFLGWR